RSPLPPRATPGGRDVLHRAGRPVAAPAPLPDLAPLPVLPPLLVLAPALLDVLLGSLGAPVGRAVLEQLPGRPAGQRRLPQRLPAAQPEAPQGADVRQARQLVVAQRAAARQVLGAAERRPLLLGLDALGHLPAQPLDEPEAE